MEQKQFDDLVAKVSMEAAVKIKEQTTAITTEINAKAAETAKGMMKSEDFEAFKEKEIAGLNTKLSELENINKEQGNKINMLLDKAPAKSRTLEDFLIEKTADLKELKASGKYVEFTGAQLKAAGITSIGGGSVATQNGPLPTSPYLPGIQSGELDIFDIVRNPNYITNKVDLGRTSTSRLAWINEVDYQGMPAQVLEGGLKPLTQHKFQVELSLAKKIAAYIQITDEFDEDVPGLATQVRRMLQADVIRAWDDAIQLDIINAARPFNITGFDTNVFDATLYDAVGAMLAQVGFYNFIPNAIELNPIELWRIFMGKDTQGRYLQPPFMDRINPMLGEANKVAVGYALAGDFKQYKVDIYKDFVLKMGWINDDLIKNQFCIVGELRYHSYISDARKNALVYNNLQYIANRINGTPHS